MFRIHNRRLFWRLAGRSIRANLSRHLLTALAVFLSTVMLFSIFTIGVNYFRNLQTMMDRLDGVTDAILYAPTQEQYEQVQATPGVEAAGIRMSLGSETIPGALGFEIPLQHWYYDEEAWEYQILPMLSDVVGTYPQDTLEVMMSIDTLKRLGIEKPEVGMTIHLTRDYQLTGWFTDYTSEDRVLRSESGAREFYSDFWGWESCQLGVCWSEEGTWETLQQIPLTEAQRWVSTPQRSVVSQKQILGLLGFTALLILVGSCLFVSNILSLSVQHDIRFYGMLKTLGTTPRQLRTLVRAKAILAALAGLVPGLLAAMLLCLEVVPRALETLTNDNMSAMPRTVTFFPVIFLGTILFVALTVALSSWKPARLAGKISSMQALSYTGLPGGRRGKTGWRTGLRSMALHNVFRQKKQAVRVFASLTLGAVLILAVNSVFHLDMPEYDTNGYDITIYSRGNPISVEDGDSTFTQDMNHSAMEAITQLDGIQEMELTRVSELYMQSDPTVLWPYAKEFARWTSKDDPTAVEEKMEAYQASAGQFEGTEAVTLELSVLEEYNQTAEHPVDLDAFAAGDILLVSDCAGEVEPPEDFSVMIGQTLSIRGRDGQVQSFTIGGVERGDIYLEISPGGTGHVPGVLVSQAGMDRINPDADIQYICINAEEGQLMALDQAIQEILAVAPGHVEYVSAAQAQADYAHNQQTVALVGNGVCILMVLMGLMNYVNVMATSVQTRRRELAMMESLGMTRRQLRAMVMWEGGIYAVLSSVLFLAGCGILWAAFSDTHIDAGVLAFSFVWPPRLVVGLVLALLVLCPCISALAYRISSREPVIQRLRETS
ncbi:MAG: ABC transporter permease [Pseudoflavonifractor capillosus]|uniref:ABC transporter permease n=1 Tax=Pseudoflavonifractor capillosus TaxID=106588 RepID=UPI0023F9B11E|nr:FtsX-like permease family protein [Pseudoflavonifractor capillosus]MCI5929681.1 ABC transporter permease [Pseudoflavonifractor capillosus]